MKEYKNPIIHQDYSDPDVIRVKDDFYMIASSFNHLPSIPILHSKNLVDWSLIAYALNELDETFNEVLHGLGVWAPSIRYHNGLFYIVYPIPDEGIFEIHSPTIEGPYSKPNCLIKGKGYEDPCPIWVDDKAYMVFSFVKSRIGFNSLLAVIELTSDLNYTIGVYKIIYDGHNDNPTIEGPKFYKKGDFFYILAPAGSVKSGWQVALRSKNIYGPYETKIVLFQGDTLVNGPHQGALIDLDDEGKRYAFIHFQDKRAYGRITHLEPVTWIDDWPVIGKIEDKLLPGVPVSKEEYPIEIEANEFIPTSDDFKGGKISLIWQRPSNINDFYHLDNGLIFNLYKTKFMDEINLIPYALLTKVPKEEFKIETCFDLKNMSENSHFGFIVFGTKYKTIEFYKKNFKYYLRLIQGEISKKDKVIFEEEFKENKVKLHVNFINQNIYDLLYDVLINGKTYLTNEKAYPGKWIGTKLGYYGYSEENDSLVKIKYYHVL